jgi:hypothetical protein
MKKIFLLLAFFSSLAFGADHLLYAPSGNLILDAKVGSVVKVNKTLRVDNITNLAGTSGAPGMVPIGGMVAVMPNTHANAWQPPTTGVIKDGFMRADGAVVPTCADCVIPAGTATPNMVTRFTKGSTTSGATAGSATKNLPAHYHGFSLTAAGQSLGSTTSYVKSAPNLGSWYINLSAGSTSGGTTGTYGNTSGAVGNDSPPNVLSVDLSHSHSPSSVSGTVGNTGGCDGNSSSSCSINVEPAYMEVVWIIRVK